MTTAAEVASARVPTTDYARLEERILARDQLGAADALYGLLKQGRPLPEIVGEAVRIHAPYTHVPYQSVDGINMPWLTEHPFFALPPSPGTGKIIGSIKLPEGRGTFNTNVAFGGPERKALYVTESSQNIIYRVAMKVRGLKLFGDKE